LASAFLSEVLQIASETDLRINEIGREFLAYKETGKLRTYFGRDADIGRPISAKQNKLMHVHLFPSRLLVRGIPIRQHDRTSNIFLIYLKA
jgi:hypothetical protein